MTEGIGGLVVETHNWGKAVAFWEALGFKLEFETDHHSGRLRHPAGGLWVFVAELLDKEPPEIYPVIVASDTDTFTVPGAARSVQPFEPRPWNVMEARLADPDGHAISVQVPLAEASEPRRSGASPH